MTLPTGPVVHFRTERFHALEPGVLYRILALRIAVFVVEQNCAYQDLDGRDASSLHLTGWLPDGELVACARLLPPGLGHPLHPSIGRVITAPVVRGTGLGRRLMVEAILRTREAWGQDLSIALSAQDYALPFYEGLGFEPSGPGYLEDGIPHSPMILPPGQPFSP
jgi:ElaA protein